MGWQLEGPDTGGAQGRRRASQLAPAPLVRKEICRGIGRPSISVVVPQGPASEELCESRRNNSPSCTLRMLEICAWLHLTSVSTYLTDPRMMGCKMLISVSLGMTSTS